MIFTESLDKLKKLRVEKNHHSQNKVASISNYSYLNIEAQMTALTRLSDDFFKKELLSRRLQKGSYRKNAHNKILLSFIEMVKKFF